MFEYRRGEQLAAFFERVQNQRVRVLAERAGPWRLLRHLAAVIDELDKGQVIGAADFCVVLAECGRNVYHAGAVTQRDIIVAGDVPALLGGMDKVEQRLIFPVFKRPARERLEYLRLFAKDSGDELFGHVIDFAPVLHARVRRVGVDAERYV